MFLTENLFNCGLCTVVVSNREKNEQAADDMARKYRGFWSGD